MGCGIMPFKLVAERLVDPDPSERLEWAFDQELVRIGRQESNEVSLRDPRRLVSGRHAEIRQREGKCWLADVGSKNGTRLNEASLQKEKEYLLSDQDRIAIGDFLIHFSFIVPEIKPEVKEPELDPNATLYFPAVPAEAETLFDDLARVYRERMMATPDERKGALTEVLRKTIEGLPPLMAKRFLDLVESRFPEPDYQRERILRRPPEAAVSCPSDRYETYLAAYEGTLDIVRRYLDRPEEWDSAEGVRALLTRIDRVLAVMLDGLADAVKGRREFEAGFDLSATQVFSWKENPIKAAEGGKEIGTCLFGGMEKGAPEKAISDLEEIFTDLALHQVGIMAGFKESLRGLLNELDPAELEAEGKRRPVKIGPFRISFRVGPLAAAAAWDRFLEKHRALSEEGVRTFETILGPYFTKGYLSVQGKKKPS